MNSNPFSKYHIIRSIDTLKVWNYVYSTMICLQDWAKILVSNSLKHTFIQIIGYVSIKNTK